MLQDQELIKAYAVITGMVRNAQIRTSFGRNVVDVHVATHIVNFYFATISLFLRCAMVFKLQLNIIVMSKRHNITVHNVLILFKISRK